MASHFTPMSNMAFDIQSFQGAGKNALKGLMARSSPSRLLNLHALRRAQPTDPAYASRPFFLQPMLNRAIIVKHNMRHGEEGLDGKRQLNALKLIFPFDTSNLSFGAQSLLPSQCDLISVFSRVFESDYISADRDMKLIGLLETLPTLDRYLLQEIIGHFGFDVAPCYFSTNKQILKQQTEIIAAEAKPIIEIFGPSYSTVSTLSSGVAPASMDSRQRSSSFQYVMADNNIAGQKLSECFFNWKVVLFYRWRLTSLSVATKSLLVSLERLRPDDGLTRTMPIVEHSRRRIYDAVADALSEASAIVEDYDVLHYAVLRSARPDLFRALLCHSKTYLLALGARISRLDDALGFWSAHAPGGPDRVDAYTLENFMASFDRHLGSDLPLPCFSGVAPSLGLIDHLTPPAARSCLRSDLRD